MEIDSCEFDQLLNTPDDLVLYISEKSSECLTDTINFLVEKSLNNNFDLFQILLEVQNDINLHNLDNLLANLPVSCITNINSFFQFISNKEKSIYCLHIISLVEKISFDPQKNNMELIEILEKSNCDKSEYYLSIIIFNNPQKSFSYKIEKAKSYIDSNNEKHIIAGYKIIEKIIQIKTFDQKKEQIDWLINRYNKATNKELEVLLYTICNLYIQENIFKDIIIDAKKKNDPQLNLIISTFLWRDNSKIQDRDFFSELLKSYETINCEFMGIIQNLDFLLIDLFENDFDSFFNFLTNWISKSDYSCQSKSLCKIWSSLFSHIKMSQKASFIYTSYLLKDEFKYHRAATDIIREISVFHKSSIELDSELIKNCNISDIVFICRKILGYFINIDDTCKIFDSILQIKFEDKQICSTMINTYIKLADDYGYPILKYFKQKDLAEKSDINKLYKSIITNIENILEEKKRTEIFPELEASYEQKTTVIRKNYEENKEIAELANKESVILSLVKPVKTLYGKGCCYSLDNSEKTQAMVFSQIEQSFYISSKDIFCPVDREIERFIFRIVKRGEK